MKVWMCVTESDARECFEAYEVCYSEGIGPYAPDSRFLSKLAEYFPELVKENCSLLEHSK